MRAAQKVNITIPASSHSSYFIHCAAIDADQLVDFGFNFRPQPNLMGPRLGYDSRSIRVGSSSPINLTAERRAPHVACGFGANWSKASSALAAYIALEPAPM